MGVLGLNATKSLRIFSENGDYGCNAVLRLSNAGDRGLRLRAGTFRLTLEAEKPVDGKEAEEAPSVVTGEDGKRYSRPHVPVGVGIADDIVLWGANDPEKPTVREAELTFHIGPKQDETVERLIGIFNIIADPDYQLTMRMNGTAQLWAETRTANGSGGWAYVRDVKVELYFKPALQRELLVQ